MNFIKNINYTEESILNISDIVFWKREQKAYNFNFLPEVAIIAIKKNVFSKLTNPFTKKIKGITGVHYSYKSKILLCSEFGMGSSSILGLLEELKELGVRKFIFVGVAGILDATLTGGNAYAISKVYSSSGSSFYYYKKENISCYNKKWMQKISTKLKLTQKIAWSTDCPFRETESLIKYYKSKNCALVEMEVAGLYAFSQYYKVPSIAVLIGADSLFNQWKPPENLLLILKQQQQIVLDLVKMIENE